ncbi:MAG: hypothetical protein ACP5UJ_07770 [Athalassotoga sp.]|uniref:hypothetical protein n=1 Tax=Athalassotoga sp. TaxID=2022597 RepID=UPI003D01823A
MASGNGALYGEQVLSTNPYGWVNSAQQGPTCNATSLVVYSEIGIEQGYVATATSYDASFCGATGNPLTGAYTTYTNSGISGILLASLKVESNMATIAVSVTFSVTGPSGVDVSSFNDNLLTFSSNSNYANGTLTLTGGSDGTPYTGTLDVIGPSSIPQWVAAGDYMLTTTFTITPENTF